MSAVKYDVCTDISYSRMHNRQATVELSAGNVVFHQLQGRKGRSQSVSTTVCGRSGHARTRTNPRPYCCGIVYFQHAHQGSVRLLHSAQKECAHIQTSFIHVTASGTEISALASASTCAASSAYTSMKNSLLPIAAILRLMQRHTAKPNVPRIVWESQPQSGAV
jgi:hypothetical protein